MWRSLVATAILLSAFVSACGGEPSAHTQATNSVAPGPSKRPPCPDPDGEKCLGAIDAGTYRTVRFRPALEYTVPGGWSNFEDTPGNFLLVPPGDDLAGVDAGTSDFIGAYTSVMPAVFSKGNGCNTDTAPGVAPTPQGMAAWLGHQRALRVSPPVRTALGGLRGLVVDERVRPGARLPSCHACGESVSVAGLFQGVGLSGFEHGLIPGMTMRLYLMRYQHGILLVEVDDIDAAPGDLTSLSAVVTTFRFTL